jgi:hypothetical protein
MPMVAARTNEPYAHFWLLWFHSNTDKNDTVEQIPVND